MSVVLAETTTNKCFERFYEFVKAHNEAQSLVKHTIRLGVRGTAITILRQVAEMTRDWHYQPASADDDRLPGWYTNRSQLATLADCGTRTIYDHMALLREAGLLYWQFRGRQHDFQVWINPAILLGDPFGTLTPANLSQGPHEGFSRHIRQSSPPKYTLKGDNNSTNKRCESGGNVDNQRGATPAPLSRVLEDIKFLTLNREAQTHLPEAEKTLKGGRGGAAAQPDGSWIGSGANVPPMALNEPGGIAWGSENVGVGTPPDAAPGPQAAPGSVSCPATTAQRLGSRRQEAAQQATLADEARLQRTKKELLLNFWSVARTTFWPEQRFSEAHTQDVLKIIWDDVLFGGNHCPTETACFTLYRRRLEQLTLAERYVNRQKWSSVQPPKVYFSYTAFKAERDSGAKGNFHHTTAWQVQNERQVAVMKMKQLTDRAIDSVLNLRPPRHWTGEATKIRLYAYWTNRLLHSVPDINERDRFQVAVAPRQHVAN
jgi:hypothetical protein